VPPKGQTSFRGPGQWRSQADGAQRPPNIYAELAEAARLLHDQGLDGAAGKVHLAEQALQAGNHETAAAQLQAAARVAEPEAAAHALGLRELARMVIDATPAAQPAKPERDSDDTAEHVPALED
jgi:hypothetical protein